MSQKVIVHGDLTYASQATLNTQLNTLHASTPIGALHTADFGTASLWAGQWATQNRVPLVPLGARLDAEGYSDPPARRVRLMNVANPDAVVAAGTGAGATHIAALATKRGKTLVQI